MPRARNIKYSFFMDDRLAEENEAIGRILYIGLWTIADCNGNLEWRSKKVKAEILPYDNCDIEKLAINLDKSGFIRFYSDGDILYCHIPSFAEEQNPHKNERDAGSKVPLYSEDMRQAVDFKGLTINLDKSGLKRNLHRTDHADSCFLIPDSFILNPESRNPDSCRPADSCPASQDDPPPEKPSSGKSSKKPDKYSEPVDKLFDHWLTTMNKNINLFGAPGIKKRKSLIRSRLKEGYELDQIANAINGCSASEYHMKNGYDDLTLICRDGIKVEQFSTQQIRFEKPNPVKRQETEYERVMRETAEIKAEQAKNITPADGENQ